MKANILKIRFNIKFIIETQSTGKTNVIESVLNIIKEKFHSEAVLVLSQELHQCKIIVVSDGDVEECELRALLKNSPLSVEDSFFSVEIAEIDKNQLINTLKRMPEKLNKENIEFLKKELDVEIDTVTKERENEVKSGAKENPAEKKEKRINLDELMGMENLKKWVEETLSIAEYHREIALAAKPFNNNAFLMSIDRGNGLTTILEVMSETLKKTGLVGFNGGRDYIEESFRYSSRPEDYGMLQHLSGAMSSFKGILAIDLTEWIDHLSDIRFRLLLDLAWEFRDNIVFVFTIPYVEDEVLDKIAAQIEDVISVRTMKFVPLTDKQYFDYLGKILKKFDIQMEENAFGPFVSEIIKERRDGKFYGFNTITKIANELLYKVIAESAMNHTEIPKVIGKSDFARIFEIENDELISGLEQLNGLVGLQQVKDKVKEILSTVQLQKKMFENGKATISPCYHMVFTGNPGTGKTVVARIIGRIFKEEGLLPLGNFYETSRKDFVGEHVGHTAPKTMQTCRNAIGSVLFIDEAYSLADGLKNSFEGEAIAELIAAMENNRDKMVVILAGYEKEMQDLFDMNPGLRDRVPHHLDFPNYNRDELKEIFYLQLKGKMEYDENFAESVDKFFEEFPESAMMSREFSNGRFARNLAERTLSKAALRFEISGESIDGFKLSGRDFELATADKDYTKLFVKVKKKNRIGFQN